MLFKKAINIADKRVPRINYIMLRIFLVYLFSEISFMCLQPKSTCWEALEMVIIWNQ